MIRFNCDYSEGAHKAIMDRLMQTNMEQTAGYGEDEYCEKAKELIRAYCKAPEADVHFLVGGTQTNLTVIAAALRPHQGVMASSMAHIQVHETGSIEACGHKVITFPSENGKITANQVWNCYQSHKMDESFEHMVQPKMVYVSNPTELGTIYSKEELRELSRVCKENHLYLFLDGARLGYGLAAEGNTLTMEDIAEFSDVFYIGGTKVGALFGEAVVIINPELKTDFRYLMKQRGAMLAKGRLLGIQFQTLFENDLYMEISRYADRLADRLREAFRKAGYLFLVENTTNQIFPIIPDVKLDELKKNYSFSYQQRVDNRNSAVRFCTSWATKEEDVDRLIRDL